MEIDMSTQHQTPPPRRNTVGFIALIIACVLFLVGLVLYISHAGDLQNADQLPQGAEQEEQMKPRTTPKAARVEGQVIVKFKKGVTTQQITERITPLRATIKSQISGIDATVLTVPPGQEDAVLKDLANDQLVQYAEPDYVYYLEFSPNDTDFGLQWGLVNTGQTVNGKAGKADADIDAEFAWDVSRGTGVTVAVLDSGIDTAHPELAAKIKGSKTFTTAGIPDKNGHGTHVSGILAATTNNGQGIAGVCPDCQLLIGKITNDDAGGTVPGSAIAPGITWAADSGAQVINMSIAGPSYSQAVQDAVNYAWGKNVVIVAAAGNSGSATKAYPAAYDNVVAVANSTSSDTRRSDSNYGTWVDVAAPGDNIYSTLPTTASFIGKTLSYGYLSGTSMASPAVAGVAALVWKTQYGTNNASVVQRIFDTAEKISGTGTYWIYGRVNAASAVGANTNPSAAPTTTVPGPTTQVSIVPTWVCGGSTNSICPIPSVSYAVQPSGATNPTAGANNPTGVVPSGGVAPDPCQTVSASIAHRGGGHHSKHRKKSHGHVGRFMNSILRFFIELLNMLLKLIGEGKIPVPTNPSDPQNPLDPCLSPTPSVAPSGTPQPSGVQSSPVPSTPVSLIPSISAVAECANPVWSSSDPNGMWSTNGMFIHNNMWNTSANPGPQTTYACSTSNWYVTSAQTNSAGAVKTYPNVHQDFNKPLSSFTSISSTFAHTAPAVDNGIWNFAYDVWLNGTSLEVMIWTDNKNQVPSGSKVSTVTFSGKTYDVWKTSDNKYIAFVQQPMSTSETINILEMLKWLQTQGWLATTVDLYQIGYGVEIVSTNGTAATFKFTNFSLSTS